MDWAEARRTFRKAVVTAFGGSWRDGDSRIIRARGVFVKTPDQHCEDNVIYDAEENSDGSYSIYKQFACISFAGGYDTKPQHVYDVANRDEAIAALMDHEENEPNKVCMAKYVPKNHYSRLTK